MATQDEIFAASEADQWFERNKHVIGALDENDVPLRLVELYKLAPTSVLEIGASNGYRVAEIARRTKARGVAVEPSGKAIEDGRARFPHVEYHQGTAANLPVTTTFDLVIINYVLHWIDRKTLLRSIAEIDRVIADGGYLLLGDFHPWHPTRNKYHHLPDQEVMTYKQDYAQIFLATELYQPVAMMTSYNGTQLDATVPDDKRGYVSFLRKRS